MGRRWHHRLEEGQRAFNPFRGDRYPLMLLRQARWRKTLVAVQAVSPDTYYVDGASAEDLEKETPIRKGACLLRPYQLMVG